jgi:hypothetical protein
MVCLFGVRAAVAATVCMHIGRGLCKECVHRSEVTHSVLLGTTACERKMQRDSVIILGRQSQVTSVILCVSVCCFTGCRGCERV